MVVTVMWSQSWLTVFVSLFVLILLILFIILCLCWERTSVKLNDQFYIMDENGLQKTDLNTGGFFRRFSNATFLKSSHLKFSTLHLNGNKISVYDKSNLVSNERELMDSLDVDERFNDTILQIDSSENINVDNDDAKSFISNTSRCSFYSVYPYERCYSVAGTMRSALSYQDNLDQL